MKQLQSKTGFFFCLLLLLSNGCQDNGDAKVAPPALKSSSDAKAIPLGNIAITECEIEGTSDRLVLTLNRTYDSTYLILANDFFLGIYQDTIYTFQTLKYRFRQGFTYSEIKFEAAICNDTLLGIILNEFFPVEACKAVKYYLFKKVSTDNGHYWKKLEPTTLELDTDGVILGDQIVGVEYFFTSPYSIRKKFFRVKRDEVAVQDSTIYHFNPIDGTEIRHK